MKNAILIMVAALAVSATGRAQESCDMSLPQMQAAMNLASQAYAKVLAPRLQARGLNLQFRSAHVVRNSTTGQDQIEIKTTDDRTVALHNDPMVEAVATGASQGIQCQAIMQTDDILAVYDAKSDAEIMSFMTSSAGTNLNVPTQSVINF